MTSDSSISFVYATAPGGQHLKIPLSNTTHVDTGEIKKRLLAAGIPVSDLQYVSFSYDSTAPTKKGMEALASGTPTYPALPKIAGPTDYYPKMSDIAVNSSVTLSDLMSTEGAKYCMEWINNGYHDLLANWVKPQQENPTNTTSWFADGINNADYLAIINGDVRLSFGYVWLWANRQNITPAIQKYIMKTTYKEGMSTENSLQISSSIGVAIAGVSASLSITFGHKVVISKETTVEDSVTVSGTDGKIAVFSLWELAEIFIVETKDSNGNWVRNSDYEVGVLNKGNPVTLYDKFDGNIDGLSDPLRFDTQTFPEGS